MTAIILYFVLKVAVSKCQPKDELFWKVFIYFQHTADGNANQAATAFILNII